MPERREPPPTAEGWYALHDLRRIDWDAWRETDEEERSEALAAVIDHLETHFNLDDEEAGQSAMYSILGHKADFMIVHLRPSTANLGALERQFELTDFAAVTERVDSFVSVTEASGYSEDARGFFEDDEAVDPGLANYIQTRLEPTIPEATHVCFYPMSKRRTGEDNWYDLSFEERAEHMEAHGEIGREYGGKVTQMITGAVAMDDWEWGVTLWGDDLVDMKSLLYEMRFDSSTARFAEFGRFYVGRRMEPTDLPTLLAGGPIGAEDLDIPASLDVQPPSQSDRTVDTEDTSESDTIPAPGDTAAAMETGETDQIPETERTPEPAEPEDIAAELVSLGLHESRDYDGGEVVTILYSGADAQDLAEEVDGLRGHFEDYDSHVKTVVRAVSGKSAVASLWETERAADIAHGFLVELPGVSRSMRGPVDGSDDPTQAEHESGEKAADRDDSTDGENTASDIRKTLAELDVYGGQPHGEDVFALVLYSEAAVDDLEAAVADLRDGFDRYDTHEGTTVYEQRDGSTRAVVSLWSTQDAADTASGYLADLPGLVGFADEGDGFTTMGMFYRVKPEHCEDFVEKFDEVGGLLSDQDGHRESALLVNVDDDNDMFIASHWASKDDAMEFFRSDAFSDTVDWGRDVLADKPRHVFFA